jgi:branched-subunit amino acid aminotransferase/4-amino-4-deoxychorismate lyase
VIFQNPDITRVDVWDACFLTNSYRWIQPIKKLIDFETRQVLKEFCTSDNTVVDQLRARLFTKFLPQ